MEEGAVMMTGFEPRRVKQALEILEGQPRGEKRSLKMVKDYEVSFASEKVLRSILSYTEYVRKNV